MDMAFTRRSERMLENRQLVRLDYALLVAALAAQGAGAGSDRPPPARPRPLGTPGDSESLTEILVGGPDWREASEAQGGCFSRAEAGRRVNVP